MQHLSQQLVLSALLEELRVRCGGYEIVAHWTQGEFHHDLILRLPDNAALPGRFLAVATNCNGGVKELLLLGDMPTRGGLWKLRCPENPEFDGATPKVLARSTTLHW